MPKIRVSFEGVNTFEVLPVATYAVQIEAVEERPSNSSEWPYLNWTFEIEEGDAKGRKLWAITSLSPKAAFKLREFLIAVGEPEANLTAEFDFDPDDYVGSHMKVAVIQETYQGVVRNKCDTFIPAEQPRALAGAGAANGGATSGRRIIR